MLTNAMIGFELRHKGDCVVSLECPAILEAKNEDYFNDLVAAANQTGNWILKAASIFGLNHPVFEYNVTVYVKRGLFL